MAKSGGGGGGAGGGGGRGGGGTITVRLAKGKSFSKGLKYARRFGGRYNPQDKTWTIPTHQSGIYNTSLNAPQLYGLVPVS